MKRIILLALIVIASINTYAQQVDSDIYLIEYNVGKDGKYYFAPPFNFTKRKGYDNQPCFSNSGEHIYYVAYKDTVQSDIYDYSIYDSTTVAITNTPESEFSPTVSPDGNHLSVIRIDSDKGQRMYNILLDGTEAEPVILTTDSAAYYEWINPKTVAMVVLDKSTMLNIYDGAGEQFTQLAQNVGRCVKKIPGKDEVSYVALGDTNGFSLLTFNIASGEMGSISQLPKGVEDYAWTNDGKIICGDRGKLKIFDPAKPETGWIEIADFSKSIGEFYRIAVSPVGNMWAIVGYKGKKP